MVFMLAVGNIYHSIQAPLIYKILVEDLDDLSDIMRTFLSILH